MLTSRCSQIVNFRCARILFWFNGSPYSAGDKDAIPRHSLVQVLAVVRKSNIMHQAIIFEHLISRWIQLVELQKEHIVPVLVHYSPTFI